MSIFREFDFGAVELDSMSLERVGHEPRDVFAQMSGVVGELRASGSLPLGIEKKPGRPEMNEAECEAATFAFGN